MIDCKAHHQLYPELGYLTEEFKHEVILRGYFDISNLSLTSFVPYGRLNSVQGLNWEDILVLIPINEGGNRWTVVLHREHGYIAVAKSCNEILNDREEDYLDHRVYVKNNFSKMANVTKLMPRIIGKNVFMLQLPPKYHNNYSWCRWDKNTMRGVFYQEHGEERMMLLYKGFMGVSAQISEKEFTRRLESEHKIQTIMDRICLEMSEKNMGKNTPSLNEFLEIFVSDFAGKFSSHITRKDLGHALREIRVGNKAVMPEFEDFE